MKMDQDNGNVEALLSTNATLAEPRSSSSNATGKEETYDPDIHDAMWHNDLPFVLDLYTRRQKKCHGCRLEFASSKESIQFVIRHEERVEFWTNHGKKTTQVKKYYHCNALCIRPRHPYFKPREVTAPPLIANKLTKEDTEFLRCFGMNL